MLEFSWVFYRIRIILRIFQMMKFLAGQIPRSCIAFHWWFPIELAGEIIRWVCIKIGYRDHRGWINTKIGAKSGPQDCKFWPIPKIYLIPKPIFCCMLRHFAPFAAWHFFDPKTQSAHLVQLQTLGLRPSQIAKQLVTQLQGALGPLSGDPVDGKWMMASSVFSRKWVRNSWEYVCYCYYCCYYYQYHYYYCYCYWNWYWYWYPSHRLRRLPWSGAAHTARTTGKIRLIWANTWGFFMGMFNGKTN